MSEKLIIAPEYRKVSSPLIFLAGSIQGAPDWQSQAIEIIHGIDSKITKASPRRPVFQKYDNVFNEQVEWETHFLNKAGEQGVILSWLAKEIDPQQGREYAQTTRYELATWKEKHLTRGTKLTIGIEEGFFGSSYLKKMIPWECPDIEINDSLQETCRIALLLISKE